MRLSETSSWPSRASSNASPAGTVTSAGADQAAAPEAARRRSSRASCGPPGPASATTTSPAAARRDEVVEALAVGRVELEQPAEAGVGGLGDELPELALEAGRDEDGAAAGEGPQRGCGRQSGGGADVHEREAHRGFAPGVVSRLTSWPTATARRRERPTRPGSARP